MYYKICTMLSWMLYIPFSLFLLYKIWRHQNIKFWPWFFEISFYGAGIFSIFLLGVWPFVWGCWARWALLLVFFLVATKSFFNVSWIYEAQSIDLKPRLSLFLNVVVFGMAVYSSGLALKGYFLTEPGVSLQFPLQHGKFCIVHGGGNELLNHHFSVSAQKFALDIVQINASGFSSQGWMSNELNDYVIFGAPLYSPCEGTVIAVSDTYLDVPPFVMNPDDLAGNYIAIAMKNSDIVVLLAHLQQGSLQVKLGDLVTPGQQIAKVGNSGHTSEPHLHIQATVRKSHEFDMDEMLFDGRGVPITFDGRFLVRNTVVSVSEQGGMSVLGF